MTTKILHIDEDMVRFDNPFDPLYKCGPVEDLIVWSKGITARHKNKIITQFLFKTNSFTEKNGKENTEVYETLTKKHPFIPILGYAKDVSGGDLNTVGQFVREFLRKPIAMGQVIGMFPAVASLVDKVTHCWTFHYPQEKKPTFVMAHSVEQAVEFVKEKIRVPAAEFISTWKDRDKEILQYHLKDWTNESIGKIYNISETRIRNIISGLKAKLGNPTKVDLWFILYFGTVSGLDFDLARSSDLDYINLTYPVELKGKSKLATEKK